MLYVHFFRSNIAPVSITTEEAEIGAFKSDSDINEVFQAFSAQLAEAIAEGKVVLNNLRHMQSQFFLINIIAFETIQTHEGSKILKKGYTTATNRKEDFVLEYMDDLCIAIH